MCELPLQAPLLTIYSQYINNYDVAEATLSKWEEKKSSFRAFLEVCAASCVVFFFQPQFHVTVVFFQDCFMVLFFLGC